MTPRAVLFLLCALQPTCVQLAAAPATASHSVPYSDVELERARARYEESVRGVWEEDFLSRLTTRERARAQGVRLEIPMRGRHGHPLDFYSAPSSQLVVLPAASIRFFSDLTIAAAYYDRHGCTLDSVFDYVGWLGYTERPLAPLEALAVPADALEDPFVDIVSQNALKSAVYFLMAHEYAHVLYRHPGYGALPLSQSQLWEADADSFAVDVMRRIGVPPLGMVLFFAAASRAEKAPGDFPSTAAYEAHVREGRTHPLTSARLLALAQQIHTHAAAFARLQADAVAWEARVTGIAEQIAEIGRLLDDHQVRNEQARRNRTRGPSDFQAACRP